MWVSRIGRLRMRSNALSFFIIAVTCRWRVVSLLVLSFGVSSIAVLPCALGNLRVACGRQIRPGDLEVKHGLNAVGFFVLGMEDRDEAPRLRPWCGS